MTQEETVLTRLETVRDLTRTLVDAVLKAGPSIELYTEGLDPDCSLVIDNGRFSLYWSEGTFLLDRSVFVNDYPHGPSWIDTELVSEHRTAMDAASGIVAALTEAFVTQEFDRLVFDAVAQECSEEEHDQ